MKEDEYVAHLYLDTDPAVDEIKILKIKDPPNSRPEISCIVQFVFRGCVFECTKYHSGNEEFSYSLCVDIYTIMMCEKVLIHMKHLELYRKEGETDMKYSIKAGDHIKVKPYKSVCDPGTNSVCGIPRDVYKDLEDYPPRVMSVKQNDSEIVGVSIVGNDQKWYVLTTDYIDGVISKSDNVNHPSHYNQNGMEVWDVIKAFTSNLSGAEAFYAGNVIKYILRWDKKNGIEDLEKAKVYIDKIIEGRKNKEC